MLLLSFSSVEGTLVRKVQINLTFCSLIRNFAAESHIPPQNLCLYEEIDNFYVCGSFRVHDGRGADSTEKGIR